MKKKLVLINPVGQKSGFVLSRFSIFPPLSLAYIAALTPSSWDVEILDENINEFKFKKADFVGITSFTSNINRAYELAGIYKSKGIKVAIGGIHASLLPEEAEQFADTVIIGEAEHIWKTVIEDFENNSLKRRYSGSTVDFKNYHLLPRRDLLSPKYFWGTIQTSRGCPFNCDFCSVTKYLGNEYRKRNTENILDELETIDNEYIFFLDDNLIGHGEKSENGAIELFKGMIKRNIKKKWWMQTSINTGENEEVLKYASKSGCLFALVGIEAINENSLKEMRKGINLKIGIENFKKIIDKFHKYGIGVLGTFIIGNDNESRKYYEELSNFIIKAGVDAVQISILTPLPGTSLYERLENQNKLIQTNYPLDWNKYRFSYLVHNPTGVTMEDVYWGNNYVKTKLYSPTIFTYRMLKSLLSLRKIDSFSAIYKMNKVYKKSWEKSHYFKKVNFNRK
jgi:radical SAM superfamily enzyme YgiQ (UPF0313 family)